MLFILSVSLINGTTVRAISSEKIQIPRTEQNIFIYDEDNIINDKTEKKLNEMLVELEKKDWSRICCYFSKKFTW